MDVVKKKSFWKKNRTIFLLVFSGIVISVLVFIVSQVIRPATMTVKKSTLLIDKAKYDDFAITVKGYGKLVPRDIYWLSSETEGRVDEILAKPGMPVQEGTLIVKLSNPELVRKIKEDQSTLVSQIAINEARVQGFDTSIISQQLAIQVANSDYLDVQLELDALNNLRKNKNSAISELAYQRIKVRAHSRHVIWKTEEKKLEMLKLDVDAQKKSFIAVIEQMKSNLVFKEKLLDSLNIRSKISGVVQQILPQIGQKVEAGASIVKIINPSDVIGYIEVPEVKSNLLQIGQKVKLNLRTAIAEGVLTRIDPTVSDGVVKIDVKFDTSSIQGLRPDLSIEGEIIIEKLSSVVHIRRPSFSSENKISTIYVYDPAAKIAYRREVQFGKVSSDQVVVSKGIKAGEFVIINNPSAWLSYKELKIN